LKYLDCDISYENETNIQQKLSKFAQILGILNNTLEPYLIHTLLRIKVYNALALPIILHGSKIWIPTKEDKKLHHSR